MADKKAISFSLSQEELKILLAYLEASELIGLDPEAFQLLSEKEMQLVMGVAERALVARGFLKPGENRLKPEEIVHAVVGACVSPETSLILSRHYSKAYVESYFFHTSRKMIVLHTVPIMAIHQFIALENRDAVVRAAVSVLQMGESASPQCPAGDLEQDVLIKAKEISEKRGVDGGKSVLSKTSLDPSTVREFSNTLASFVADTTFAFIKHSSQKESANGFSILQGSNGTWLLIPGEKGRIGIQPVSSKDVFTKVMTLIAS